MVAKKMMRAILTCRDIGAAPAKEVARTIILSIPIQFETLKMRLCHLLGHKADTWL